MTVTKTMTMTMTKAETKKLRKPETAATFANLNSLRYLPSDDNDKDIDKENEKEKDAAFCKPVQYMLVLCASHYHKFVIFFFNLMQDCISRQKNLGAG